MLCTAICSGRKTERKNMKQKIKLGIILGVEFVAITLILVLIFFAGKKTYTVTFDLNGGTLISGELEQVVSQGKSATPPTVAKDGCYLHSWSASYHQVTRDIVIKAVWEWQTSIGFDYNAGEYSDYCVITGSFKDLVGDVYVGVYYNNKRVLGIQDEAFMDRDGITYIHMLDGILSIGDKVFADSDALVSVELPGTLAKLGNSAFEGCDSLTSIALPNTLTNLGTRVFADCTSLEKVVLPNGIKYIPSGTFDGCTSLTEIVIPASVERIEAGAFRGCTALESVIFEVEEEITLDGEDKPEDEKPETEDGEEATDDGTVVLRGLLSIAAGAFEGCTSLTEITLPVTVEIIEALAFDGEQLVIKTEIAEEEKPEGWADGWNGSASVEWGVTVPEPDTDDEGEEKEDKLGWLS